MDDLRTKSLRRILLLRFRETVASPGITCPQGDSNDPQNQGENECLPENSAPDSALSADLQRVVDAWPTLPEAMRAAILAIVDAARTEKGRKST
jgi:hypothetical protein